MSPDAVQQIQDNANKLWKLLEETLSYYDSVACACAFPRFHQYVRIDCVDYGASFYMSETEGFIYHAQKYFDVQPLGKGGEVNNAIYTCKKCKSTYDYGWADFSIHVNRTVLKLQELKTETIGAEAKTPIPFVVGLFGHKYPERSLFDMVSLEVFSTYIRELKTTH